jgi:2-keto-3-deoxy-6-phosphogluconate aldolase
MEALEKVADQFKVVLGAGTVLDTESMRACRRHARAC